MLNRTSIMSAAWTRYRVVAAQSRYITFCRRLFGRVLRMAWINARAAAARVRREAAPAAPLGRIVIGPSLFDQAMDALKYLPAHMSYERAAAEVRTRFA